MEVPRVSCLGGLPGSPARPMASIPRRLSSTDLPDELVQFVLGHLLSPERSEKQGELGDDRFVGEHVVGYSPRLRGGQVEELEPRCGKSTTAICFGSTRGTGPRKEDSNLAARAGGTSSTISDA